VRLIEDTSTELADLQLLPEETEQGEVALCTFTCTYTHETTF
jgi:hypothetical protein